MRDRNEAIGCPPLHQQNESHPPSVTMQHSERGHELQTQRRNYLMPSRPTVKRHRTTNARTGAQQGSPSQAALFRGFQRMRSPTGGGCVWGGWEWGFCGVGWHPPANPSGRTSCTAHVVPEANIAARLALPQSNCQARERLEKINHRAKTAGELAR